ncbi:MAG: hypothetical protein HOJ34_07990 [Kordiimonadaceae bacterium]|jgi:hypothetical protein|nr:hypothetical protein [Kordiimonadaceae bacterium]MBT6037584.1 hypothetical protein [Kordiimonadaceae bacterium]MBT6329707.1 hypothetical protein [Kordiimonadaceae bacterium]MBT7581987.1 hypothetical protein [Kordiimonadaceae bacterium]
MTEKSRLHIILAGASFILINSVSPSYAQNKAPNDDNDATPSFDDKSFEEDYESVPLYSDRDITFITGYDHSSGKFNLPTTTNISYVPYSLRYRIGKLGFRASSGYISFAAPRNVVTAVEGTPLVTDVRLSDKDKLQTRRKNGFGDVYLSASYSYDNPFNNDLYIDFTAKVKIPTADENKGLGTGKVDYTGQIDVSYLFGNFMPYGTIGYRVIGKNQLYDLQNSLFASIGMAYYLTYDTSIGVSYDYRESATPNFNSPKEIFAYTDIQLNENWGLNVYGVVGLNNVTTDYGAGTQIRYKF